MHRTLNVCCKNAQNVVIFSMIIIFLMFKSLHLQMNASCSVINQRQISGRKITCFAPKKSLKSGCFETTFRHLNAFLGCYFDIQFKPRRTHK